MSCEYKCWQEKSGHISDRFVLFLTKGKNHSEQPTGAAAPGDSGVEPISGKYE